MYKTHKKKRTYFLAGLVCGECETPEHQGELHARARGRRGGGGRGAVKKEKTTKREIMALPFWFHVKSALRARTDTQRVSLLCYLALFATWWPISVM